MGEESCIVSSIDHKAASALINTIGVSSIQLFLTIASIGWFKLALLKVDLTIKLTIRCSFRDPMMPGTVGTGLKRPGLKTGPF